MFLFGAKGIFGSNGKNRKESKSVYETHLNSAANIVLTTPKLERSSSRSSFSGPTAYINITGEPM